MQNYDAVKDDLLGNVFSGAGLIWYGGLLGGVVAVLLWARRRDFLRLALLDMAAPALALGYAIGRIGCQISGDGDYGKASDLPWAMGYPDGAVPTAPGAPPTSVAGTVHLGADVDGLVRWSADLETGTLPRSPYLLLGQMTTADPTRSPEGTESAWAYTHVPPG